MTANDPVATDSADTLPPVAWFRALADETRLRCLLLLAAEGELCVCELTHALGVSQPRVSRHLAQLRELGAVADRRERVWVHYRLGPALPDWARDTLTGLIAARAGTEPFRSDRARLAAMPDRPGGRCVN